MANDEDARYQLRLKSGKIIAFRVVDHRGALVRGMNLGGAVQLLKYESPGSNGGMTVFNGRLGNTITKNGIIIGTDMADVNGIKTEINNAKNNGEVVVLVAPVDNDDTGEYFIESFLYNIVEGRATSLTFTMTLYENREANVRKAAVNLVNFQEGELLKARYRAQLGIQT